MKTLSLVAVAALAWMSCGRTLSAQVYYHQTPANYYQYGYTPASTHYAGASVQAARYWNTGGVQQTGYVQKGHLQKGHGCCDKSPKCGCAVQKKSSCAAQKKRGCAAQKSCGGCSKCRGRLLPGIIGHIDGVLGRLFSCKSKSSCASKGSCGVKTKTTPKCGCGKTTSCKGGCGKWNLPKLSLQRPLLPFGKCRSCESKGKSSCGCKLERGCKASGGNAMPAMPMEEDPFLDDPRPPQPPRPIPSRDARLPFSSTHRPVSIWKRPSVSNPAKSKSVKSVVVAPISYVQPVGAPQQPARLAPQHAKELQPRETSNSEQPNRLQKFDPANFEIVNPLRD